MAKGQQPELQFIRGIPLPLRLKKENVEAAMDMMPEDGDIAIVPYLRTGSTLLQYIVLQILSKGDLFPPQDELISKIAPILEMMGVSVLESLNKPRIYKSHLRFDMLQRNKKAKYLYIYRKPEDTFVSYYHFYNENLGRQLNFDRLFEDFLVGNVPFGSYFEHARAIFKHRDDSNVLLISYEKLVMNRREEILRIAKFLNEECYENLQEEKSTLEKILESTSFEYMKKNLSSSHPQLVMEGKRAVKESEKVNFFRKGIVGEGKCVLSSKQLQKLKDSAAEALKGTDLFNEWY